MFFPNDIQVLADRFTLPALRAERDKARVKMQAADFWYEPDAQYYEEYLELCEVTIKRVLQAQRKEATIKPIQGHVDIEAIKAKHDIIAVIERYIKVRKSGHRFSCVCPFHEHKTPNNPSMTIYTDTQSWYCFGCLKSGDIFDFVMLSEHCDFKQAVSILGG